MPSREVIEIPFPLKEGVPYSAMEIEVLRTRLDALAFDLNQITDSNGGPNAVHIELVVGTTGTIAVDDDEVYFNSLGIPVDLKIGHVIKFRISGQRAAVAATVERWEIVRGVAVKMYIAPSPTGPLCLWQHIPSELGGHAGNDVLRNISTSTWYAEFPRNFPSVISLEWVEPPLEES